MRGQRSRFLGSSLDPSLIGPLSLHPPPLPPLPPPPSLPLLRPHEVRKGCCARGARMWNSRSAHSVTPACRGLPLLGACTLMRYVQPTDRTSLVPVSSAQSLYSSVLGPTSSFLLLAFPPSPPPLCNNRLIPRPITFIVGMSLRDSVPTITSRPKARKRYNILYTMFSWENNYIISDKGKWKEKSIFRYQFCYRNICQLKFMRFSIIAKSEGNSAFRKR